MNTTTPEIGPRAHTTRSIMHGLPAGPYHETFQPDYTDSEQLLKVLDELRTAQPVTRPTNITKLRSNLAMVASGESGPLIIAGNCSEPLVDPADYDKKTAENQLLLDRMVDAIPDGVHVLRSCGQFTKPRSNEFEELDDGRKIVSHMGQGVNGTDPTDRQPDPNRLLAGALQSRATAEALRQANGQQMIFFAHEALNIAYEQPFIARHAGKKFLLSTDMPWIGYRTNSADGPIASMLSGIENPVGVKLGPNTTAEQVERLTEVLNPEQELGKLVLMLRFGKQYIDELRNTIDAINKYCPESIVVVDQHGNTTTNQAGQKIRSVSGFVEEVETVAEEMNFSGRMLNGIHVEAMADNSRLECVDSPDQTPTHPGNIDPQLNPRQLSTVLSSVDEVLQ